MSDAMRKALRKLTFAARTSGGTAGPDPDLMKACDDAEAILSAPSAVPQADAWQPIDIDTAPEGRALVAFADGHMLLIEETRRYLDTMHRIGRETPAHWMPLPATPLPPSACSAPEVACVALGVEVKT